MFLLIDGYNLAFEVGWLTPRQRGAGALERARNRLLSFLEHSLDEKERTRTTVVFDAWQMPVDGAAEQQHASVKVVFAVEYDEADELIEELIATHSSPKSLTVVSSDRRLVSAAQRRKATALKSSEWYEATLRDRAKKNSQPLSKDELAKRGSTKIPPAERDYWLEEFS